MIEQEGNIFDTKAIAIGHGVNVFGVMGAGIAVQFKERWPHMFSDYQSKCRLGKGALRPGDVHTWVARDKIVLSIASQSNPGPYATEAWLAMGLYKAADFIDKFEKWPFGGKRIIAIPAIGCGIGGLDLPTLHRCVRLVERNLPNVEFELWTYKE